jgi:hypothetical protein
MSFEIGDDEENDESEPSSTATAPDNLIVWELPFVVPSVVDHVAYVVARIEFSFLLGHLRLALRSAFHFSSSFFSP